MKKRTTRRALVMSLLSLLLCCSMLVGTTFAWFTDSVTSGKNKIIAGNLDVELTHTSASVTAAETVEGETELFVDENGEQILWEPGVVAWENLTVSNVGTLALKYRLAVNFADQNAVKGTGAKLSEALKVAVVDPIDATATREQVLTAAGTGTALADFVREGKLLPAGSTMQVAGADLGAKTYGIVIWWEPSAEDNKWNLQNGAVSTDGHALQIDLGIKLVATQLEAEDDSFGTDYDKDAGYNYGKNNVGPYKLNVLSGGNAVYDEATKTYTVTVDTVAQGGYNATQGGRYFAGYTVSVADYDENATLKFDKDTGEVSWKLADEERDGFINNGVHQQWTSVGTQRAYRYDVNGDGVTDFTVVNDASKAKVEAANAAELKKLLETGVSAILTADISLDVAETGFTVANGVTAKLDLNDHDIIATATSAESVQLFSVSGALDITGNGTISLTNDDFAWTESYRYTAINIRETGVVTLDNGVKVVCEAGKATAKGYGMAYAVDIYTTGTLHVNGASLHSNYIAVRCFYGDSVLNVGSGYSITSSNKNYGIWPQSAPGAKPDPSE